MLYVTMTAQMGERRIELQQDIEGDSNLISLMQAFLRAVDRTDIVVRAKDRRPLPTLFADMEKLGDQPDVRLSAAINPWPPLQGAARFVSE